MNSGGHVRINSGVSKISVDRQTELKNGSYFEITDAHNLIYMYKSTDHTVLELLFLIYLILD